MVWGDVHNILYAIFTDDIQNANGGLTINVLCFTEPVLLQDLTQDNDKRHLDAGLPPVVTFNLRRETGNVKLTLEESRHVDLNAPVFEGREDETGETRLVRQATLPITVCILILRYVFVI